MAINKVSIEDLLPEFPGIGEKFEASETYRLDYMNFNSVLSLLIGSTQASGSDASLHQRSRGIEIMGSYSLNEDFKSSGPLGMVTSGDNLETSDNSPYLVTFRHTDPALRKLQPSINLVDILRDYII